MRPQTPPKQHPSWTRHVEGLRSFAATYARSALDRGASAGQCLKIARKLGQVSDAELEGFYAGSAGVNRIACKAGCCHCCHQEVLVSPLEAIAVYHFALETFAAEELDALREAASRYRAEHRATGDNESDTAACPLLKDGLCSVRSVRPLACRGYHSFDVDACRQRLASRTLGPIPMAAEPMQIVQGISTGMGGALAGRATSQAVILGLALAVLFEVPDAAERYFAGEPVFAAADTA